ncbi:MAG TPA: isochorismate synthase [Acidimicrobiales bacterium]|nr:isochorismate synthase [Acidimicrobiales bacterium]
MSRVQTRRIDGPVDLAAFAGGDGWLFHRDGIGVAGRGVFQRVASTDADASLARLGSRVVAIGARPFSPDAAWDLVIPQHQLRVDADGNAWETVIEDGTEAIAGTAPAATPTPIGPASTGLGSIRIETVESPADWRATVARATGLIRDGRADKVVLCREVVAVADQAIAPSVLVRRLGERFGECFVFSVDGLVGASPELLVERTGDTVRSQPMAGTARRSADPVADEAARAELFASPTYRHEHQLTIDMVHDTLLDFTSYLDFEPEPAVIALANVFHLASRVEGQLSAPPASVLDLQAALHPTPAVSGRPRDAAVALIEQLEGRVRGRYAGTVGWVDGAGNGCWAVTIRCAQIDAEDPRRARIHAGCGLVADSEPERELAESEAKLQAILSVLED